ncbi:hypothetical protein FMN50_00500 [Rhodobacterales bacterium]|nr:hypothetical protein FMN50_00500 [Rhodobacterales bacterium]
MPKRPDERLLIYSEQGQKWLNQFEPLDLEVAIKLANSLTLVSHSEFQRKLKKQIMSVADTYDGAVALYAVRELATRDWRPIPFFEQVLVDEASQTVNSLSASSDQGSEAIVAQVIRSFSKENPKKYLNHPTKEKMKETKCNTILFIDDIVGSGKRVRDFIDSFLSDKTIRSWRSLKYVNFDVVSYSATDSGYDSVISHRSAPKLHIERDAPSFHTIPMRTEMRDKIFALCRKYGRIANKRRKNMWFGFHEGMAAIVFEHGCPNNTPGILWEPDFKNSNWIGLFPNRTVSSSTQSVFPEEVKRRDTTALLLEIGQKRIAQGGALLRRGELGQKILVVLGLIAIGQRKRSTLSFATGLNTQDCEKLLSKCIKWGFITPQRRITPKGNAELNAARKYRGKLQVPLEVGSDYYYPLQLRGAAID